MFDLRALFTAEGLASLVSLTVMEIVLGIDNIVFVAILSQNVAAVGSSRVDLQACKLEYSIVSPK